METVGIGLVGMGEAGLAFGAGLAESGGARVTGFDVRLRDPSSGAGLRDTATALGMDVVDSVADVLATSTVVFSFVTAVSAARVVADAAPNLAGRHVFVDANSASPELMLELARSVEDRGAEFVDAAVMAAVGPQRHRVPMLVSGGGSARLIAICSPLGLRAEAVPGGPGAASCVKMMRSLLVKGVEALLLQTGRASVHYGVFDRVLSSMGDLPFDDWIHLADYLLGRTAVHAERRGHELEEVARTLQGCGVDAALATAGARALLDAAASGRLTAFADRPPRDRHEVITALEGDSPYPMPSS